MPRVHPASQFDSQHMANASFVANIESNKKQVKHIYMLLCFQI